MKKAIPYLYWKQAINYLCKQEMGRDFQGLWSYIQQSAGNCHFQGTQQIGKLCSQSLMNASQEIPCSAPDLVNNTGLVFGKKCLMHQLIYN